ncbi:MAG: SpoIIIAH-like family protein [Lachnospiraceae bacterium]|nr:SpoIIIAH-like family protein [Lachnospiraceae bacterium]
MKNLIKKNRLMITALAIMIAIAGYLQFAGNNLEEDYLDLSGEPTGLVDTSGLVDTTGADSILGLTDGEAQALDLLEIQSLDSELDVLTEDYLDTGMEVADGSTTGQEADGQLVEATPSAGEIPGEAVFTTTDGVMLLADAKLLKEQTRAKNKETLLEIINSAGLTDEQKQTAVNSMIQMTDFAEKEAGAEILLEAKGFSDVVVSISSTGVDVVVNALELTDVQRAQIEDIVTRKTDVTPENIVISTVTE